MGLLSSIGKTLFPAIKERAPLMVPIQAVLPLVRGEFDAQRVPAETLQFVGSYFHARGTFNPENRQDALNFMYFAEKARVHILYNRVDVAIGTEPTEKENLKYVAQLLKGDFSPEAAQNFSEDTKYLIALATGSDDTTSVESAIKNGPAALQAIIDRNPTLAVPDSIGTSVLSL